MILDSCVALARASAEGEGAGEGEAGPDRLRELVTNVAARIASLSSPGSAQLSGVNPKEVMQAVYEQYAEVLEAEENKDSYTKGEVIKRLKAVLKRVSHQYA